MKYGWVSLERLRGEIAKSTAPDTIFINMIMTSIITFTKIRQSNYQITSMLRPINRHNHLDIWMRQKTYRFSHIADSVSLV